MKKHSTSLPYLYLKHVCNLLSIAIISYYCDHYSVALGITMMMTEATSSSGLDVESPVRTTTTTGSSTAGNVDGDSRRKKQRGFVSAFLLAAVVAISVGVTLGGGGGENATTVKVKNSSSATDNAVAPATSISVAVNGGDTFVATLQEEEGGDVIDNKVRYLDNPQAAVGGESKVRIIDSSVTRGYNSCNELMEDLRNALNYYVNSVIDYEAEYSTLYEQCDPNDPNKVLSRSLYDDATVVEHHVLRSAKTDYAGGDDPIPLGATPRSKSGKTEKENNSYETKNQAKLKSKSGKTEKENSHESKSGKTKKESSEIKNQFPGVDEADFGVDNADFVKSDGEYVFATYGQFLYAWNAIDGPNKGVSITELPDFEEVKICDLNFAIGSRVVTTKNDTELSSSNSSSVQEEPCYYYQPKPVIFDLLLHEDRLTAIVSEETLIYSSNMPTIISDNTQLTIQVYDISNIPLDDSPLTLLAKSEKPIKGTYNVALSSKNTGILAATSSIDTSSLVGDLYRYNTQYCGLNSTEYTKLAVETASNRTETFIASMLEELQLKLDGTCESIVQIAAMQSGDSTQDASNGGQNGKLLGTFLRVVNFDMASDFIDEKVVFAGAAGSFLPGWPYVIPGSPYVYATQDFVATITVGSSYNTTHSGWDYSTSFILGFDISGDTATSPRPFCFAEVPGTVSNFFADVSSTSPNLFESNFIDVYEGHLRIFTTEYFPEKDSTTVTVSVLNVPPPTADAGTEMLLTGQNRLELVSTNDSVLFARLTNDLGYIEVNGRSFVSDMSDPSDPKTLNRLEASEHFYYLEPIKIDGVSHMLGVGVVVNETSWTYRVKITVFDVSDPANLQAKASYIEKSDSRFTEKDFHSIRYLQQSHKLILPKEVYIFNDNYNDTGMNFDGFVVYDINATDITPIYDIRHMLSEDMYNGCINKAYLPDRSFVFESKLTTILSHSVICTDLETGEHWWAFNLENRSNTIDCEPYPY